MLVEFHRRGSPLAELGSRLKFCLGDIIAHYGLQGPPGYAETALHSFPPERRYGKGHVNSKGGCRECARLPMAAERESADAHLKHRWLGWGKTNTEVYDCELCFPLLTPELNAVRQILLTVGDLLREKGRVVPELQDLSEVAKLIAEDLDDS